MNTGNDWKPLRSLPEEKASELFTPRVMARVRALGRRPVTPRRARLAPLAMSVGGVLLLALALGVTLDMRRGATPPSPEAVVATESDPLSALESIETGATQFEPVIYVGSTDHYDFYLDLRPSQGAADVHPASYRGNLQPGL